MIVFPLALFVPATRVHLTVRPLELLTLLPLACVTGAALGLLIGTRVSPRQMPLIFGIVVIPITFLGATYYPWASLTPIPWLKAVVLLNPLVYMSEAMRVSLTPQFPHMALWAIYGGLILSRPCSPSRGSWASSNACRPDERRQRVTRAAAIRSLAIRPAAASGVTASRSAAANTRVSVSSMPASRMAICSGVQPIRS